MVGTLEVIMQIVRDINVLKKVSEPITCVYEATDIIEELEKVLNRLTNGIGLAAIQIGIPKRIAVIKGEYFKDKKPLYLINPKLVEGDNKFMFGSESCLSFPGLYLNTDRYAQILIENDEIVGNKFSSSKEVYFYPRTKEDDGFMSTDKLVCIAVQHELDHFDGKVLPEFGIKNIPMVRGKAKIARNEPCPCGSGKKYKKCCYKV